MGVGDIYWKNWVESFFIIVLLIGFLIAITIKSTFLNYIIIFFAGLVAGRVLAMRVKKQPMFAYVLIMIGFLLGYLIGSFEINKKLIALWFIIGGVISYYLHRKGYIK